MDMPNDTPTTMQKIHSTSFFFDEVSYLLKGGHRWLAMIYCLQGAIAGSCAAGLEAETGLKSSHSHVGWDHHGQPLNPWHDNTCHSCVVFNLSVYK